LFGRRTKPTFAAAYASGRTGDLPPRRYVLHFEYAG
jgi:hypothetical protein